MTIWRPSPRRPERVSEPRRADIEMGVALVLMGAVIVLTTIVVPALGG